MAHNCRRMVQYAKTLYSFKVYILERLNEFHYAVCTLRFKAHIIESINEFHYGGISALRDHRGDDFVTMMTMQHPEFDGFHRGAIWEHRGDENQIKLIFFFSNTFN